MIRRIIGRNEEANVRKTVRLALVAGFVMSLLAGPAQASSTQAGPCAALGDVCWKVLYRPMDQICRLYEVCL